MDDVDEARPRSTVHVLVAGGGTGGHVFPALAVADELVGGGHSVSWVGRPEGMEETLVRKAGLPFHPLAARPWLGRGAMSKLGALATLAASAWKARGLIRSMGADAVFGTGGYVSAPAVVGARLAGRPAMIFEPNARSGAANRVVSRWCREALTAYEDTGGDLRCPSVVTGTPVRSAFHRIGSLPVGPPHLLVLGGSQGALQINQMVPELVAGLRQSFPDLTVTHQTGRAHLEAVRTAYADRGLGGADGAGIETAAFLEDVAGAMARAHVIVSRAGALTCAEIAAAGRPAVFVPLTASGGGHQRYNATSLERGGAALVLDGDELTAADLLAAVTGLLEDRPRLEAMARSARLHAHPEAAERIADRLVAGALSPVRRSAAAEVAP